MSDRFVNQQSQHMCPSRNSEEGRRCRKMNVC